MSVLLQYEKLIRDLENEKEEKETIKDKLENQRDTYRVTPPGDLTRDTGLDNACHLKEST